MSSIPAIVSAAAISSSLRPPSVYARLTFRSPIQQQFGTPGALLEDWDDTLYRWSVVGGDITSDDVPLPIPRLQMKSDNVEPEPLDGLHRITR